MTLETSLVLVDLSLEKKHSLDLANLTRHVSTGFTMTTLVTLRGTCAPSFIWTRARTSKTHTRLKSTPIPVSTGPVRMRTKCRVLKSAIQHPEITARVSQSIAELAAAKTTKVVAAASVSATPLTFATVLASSMAFPVLWAFAAIPCCLAFINPIYVFSVGYGLSAASYAVGILAMLSASGVWVSGTLTAHLIGALLYGVRLGVFLYIRSITWTEWNKKAKNAPEAKAQSIPQKVLVITLCSLLYAAMCSPMLWHAQVANSISANLLPVIYFGLITQWVGFILESIADSQKSAHKRKMASIDSVYERSNTKWCSTGVYEKCRHPNYLGEVLFWVGTFVAGVPAMSTKGWWSFAPAALGVGFILKLMTSQCVKQDEKQEARYGENEAYTTWVTNSGSLFPKLG